MIRKNLINCNLIREKNSTKSLFDSCMTSFRIETEVCPSCKRTGDCKRHAYYYRYIVDFINGHSISRRIRVLRVICSCGKTHAILPDPIIPYAPYSLFFILRVITEYSLRFRTVSKLCNAFEIPPTTLYRWLKLYKEHRYFWQGYLVAAKNSLFSSLKALFLKDPFNDFALTFFKSTGISFMQSHKNPTGSKRRKNPP